MNIQSQGHFRLSMYVAIHAYTQTIFKGGHLFLPPFDSSQVLFVLLNPDNMSKNLYIWLNFQYIYLFRNIYCLGTGVHASGEFAHTYCTCKNCKIIGKVKMETTGVWGLILIILKDIKCFQIWAYFEGIGINFNFENV